MRRDLGSRLLPAFVFVLALTACGESYEWRQKVTVTVETPDGEFSGSSVQSVKYRKSTRTAPLEGSSSSWTVEGEAVLVALPNQRYLFALLKGETTFGDVHHILQSLVDPGMGPRTHEALSRAAAQPMGSMFRVGGRNRPMLVTFADIADPASVRRVDPDNLAASLGSGYSLEGITHEITSEAVTAGRVEAVLKWLCGYINPFRRLSGKSGPISDNELSNNLGPGSFRIGECTNPLAAGREAQ